jgi:hypothetical protein
MAGELHNEGFLIRVQRLFSGCYWSDQIRGKDMDEACITQSREKIGKQNFSQKARRKIT